MMLLFSSYLAQRRLELASAALPVNNSPSNGNGPESSSSAVPQKRGPSTSSNTNPDGGNPTKRPRGRPKGSKNKAKGAESEAAI
jgi:hypothetical protein